MPTVRPVGSSGIAGTVTHCTFNHHFAPSRLTVIAFGSPKRGR